MNAKLFRLVFNRALGMLVPVWEGAKTQAGGARSKGLSPTTAFAVTPLAASLSMISALYSGSAFANDLPVPCAGAPASCGSSGVPLNFVTSGAATFAHDANSATVTQQSARAILNWQSFDIGAGKGVTFNQPGADSVALNRIFQGSPSQILGSLTANGQIYLINQNGIIFSNGAQVNASTLIASTLNVSDELFNGSRIFSQTTLTPAFEGTESAGSIVIDSGALLRSSQGGKVMLFGSNVTNNGRIESPGGQVIIGAGQKVYLRGSGDASLLRGLIVELDNGGTATNGTQGVILADRGNIFVSGLAVNQQGRISATTTVQSNGQIRLVAADTVNQQAGLDTRVMNRTGTVRIESGSRTEVTPVLSDTGTLDSNATFSRSRVDVVGQSIFVGGEIRLPSGQVNVTAVNASELKPVNVLPERLQDAVRDSSKIFVDRGARIDVSGVKDVELQMSKNEATVELRGDELRDRPLQRNGFLRGKRVTVDVSQGTPVADLERQFAVLPRTLGELSTVGGEINFETHGDIVLKAGSTLDVSGGFVRYLDGYLRTTQLTSQGRVYDIGSAPADIVYDGFANQFTVRDEKWGTSQTFISQGRFVPSYLKGSDAGTVSVKSYAMVTDSEFIGTIVNGPYQRDASTRAKGGQLILDDFTGATVRGYQGDASARYRDVLVGRNSDPYQGSFLDALPNDRRTVVDASRAIENGFSRLSFARTGRTDVEQRLELAPGGSVTVNAREINVNNSITVPAGSIALAAAPGSGADPTPLLNVLPGVTLTTRGQFTNDLVSGNAVAPAFLDGGNVSLTSTGGRVTIGARDGERLSTALLDVSGGAHVLSDGSLRKGQGGNLTIRSEQEMLLGAVIRGYAMGQAGKLTVAAPEMVLRDGALEGTATSSSLRASDALGTGRVVLPTAFFRELGFGEFEVEANLGDLVVAAGTEVAPIVPFVSATSGLFVANSGADILSPSLTTLRSDVEFRSPAKIALNSTVPYGDSTARVALETGSSIVTDPKGAISVTAQKLIFVDGTLSAPAGDIEVHLVTTRDARGVQPAAGVWFGPNASLSARATFVPSSTPRPGLIEGEVLSAGSISVFADRGYVVAQPGARFDVSGGSAAIDVLRGDGAGYERRQVAANAGRVSVRAAEGGFVDAALLGQAAGDGSRGGELVIGITAALRNEDQGFFNYPTGPRRLVVSRDNIPSLSPDIRFGDVVPVTDPIEASGRLYVSQRRILSGGFDKVTLFSDTTIDVVGNVALNARSQINIDAPRIDVSQGSLSAQTAAASIGSARLKGNNYFDPQDAGSGSTGSGAVDVNASLIDFYGNFAMYGANRARFASQGDIRLIGVQQGGTGDVLSGSIAGAQPLEFVSAQMYPTTYSNFEIRNPGGTVVFDRVGKDSPVFSAGGVLTVRADAIEQRGVLKAPLGEIALVAPQSGGGRVSLGVGSITSTSAEGQSILFGRVQNSADWVYQVGANTVLQRTPRAKNIRIEGENLALPAGAIVDVSGGGDLLGYEFVPGPTGSVDVLAANRAGKSFAIVPAQSSPYAPYDPEIYGGARATPGEMVELTGGNGTPAGRFALLPARYAVLPGAYLVTPEESTGDLVAGRASANVDGSYRVTGYFADAGSGARESKLSVFTLRSNASVNNLAQYTTYSGNTFFSDRARLAGEIVPRLPADAGALSLIAQQTLSLDATLRVDRAQGANARGATVDIAANAITIASPNATVNDGSVVIRSDAIARLGAESILIGGTRTQERNGVRITQVANTVTVKNDANAPLNAPEILLSATGGVTVSSGSVISASGTRATVTPLLIGSDFTGGDGALLRVSTASDGQILRSNVSRSAGDLSVESGAIIQGRSIDLDSTNINSFEGTLQVDPGGVASFGAGRISFGSAPAATDGLVFTSSALTGFQQLERLALRSYTTVDFYGDVTLGGGTLRDVTVVGGGVRGFGVASNAPARTIIAADIVTFTNPNTIPIAPSVSAGAGSALVVNANTVVIGEGAKALRGYETVTLNAATEISFAGTGRTESSGTTALNASRVVAQTGSRQSFDVVNDGAASAPTYSGLTIDRTGSGANLPGVNAIGGVLNFTGSSVISRGTVLSPSGKLSFEAKGPGNGVVELAAGSVTSVAAIAQDFAGTQRSSAAGEIALRSQSGSVRIDRATTNASQALVDVSGAGTGDAGSLVVSAPNGAVDIGGLLRASHTSGRGGSFTLDGRIINADAPASTNALSALTGILNAGGFSESRSIRVRTGDLTVESGSANEVIARNVTLSADSGSITVAGGVGSASNKAGAIRLYANQVVTLATGSSIVANSTGQGQRGGQVEIAGASAVIQSGATVNVTPGAQGSPGSIHVRVDANTTNNTVAFSRASGSTFTGANGFTVEAVQRFSTAAIDDAFITGTVRPAVDGFMANRAAIASTLGGGRLVAGAEVTSSSDLSVSSPWDFSSWRYGDSAGHLTLRAQGNLTVAGTISDGFSGVEPGAAITAGNSWSYRIAGGADLQSANPNDVLARGVAGGDVILNANTLIRTGQGSINIAAANHVEIGKDVSGANKSTAAVYTVGVPAAPLNDFIALANANYLERGGDISIHAGGDVRGAITHQLTSEWLERHGQMSADGRTLLGDRNPSWWINPARFQQNVGALGGGDVTIQSGGNLDNLSVVIPTTGRVVGGADVRPTESSLVVLGGGDLDVKAGGDIRSGLYYVARGNGSIVSGGSIVPGRIVSDTNSGGGGGPFGGGGVSDPTAPIGTLFALGDARLKVSAVGNVSVESVYNPTVIPQDTGVRQGTGVSASRYPNTYFFTYSPNSGFAAESLTGNLTFTNNAEAIRNSVTPSNGRTGLEFLTGQRTEQETVIVYPGEVTGVALSGSVVVERAATLYPSATGNLQLLAATNVNAAVSTPLVVSNVDPADLLNPLYIPTSGQTATTRTVSFGDSAVRLQLPSATADPSLRNAVTPVHLAEAQAATAQPIRIVARNGDIEANLQLAKRAEIFAGRDIVNLNLEGQNLVDTDATTIVAGRNIRYETGRKPDGSPEARSIGVAIGGPGRVSVQAGGNIDLGTSNGIVTRGNLSNSFLPREGAQVSVLAGVAPTFTTDAFIDRYIDPSGPSGLARVHRKTLVEYVTGTRFVVLGADGNPVKEDSAEFEAALSAAAPGAFTTFQGLPEERQRRLVESVFYDELRRSGRAFAQDGSAAYQRGFAAIDSLFGPSSSTGGSLSLLFSQLKTEAGGNISIWVPSGDVNAGQTTPPGAGLNKGASQLGIIAADVGGIRAFVRGREASADSPAVRGNFAVNESRVFTLRGGDILIWSSDGDIDAGRGAKTAVSAPPPLVITDSNGNTSLVFQNLSGSGIRSILTDPTITPGDVDLIAPAGIVDAGDAGIGAAGNLTIAAVQVRGADNINVGGRSTGVPVDTSGSLAGTFTSASSATADSAKAVARAVDAAAGAAREVLGKRGLPSFLTVEVISIGDGGSGSNVEIKRRRPGRPEVKN